MQIGRIYTDEKGETHFAELKIELQDAGAIGLHSSLSTVTR